MQVAIGSYDGLVAGYRLERNSPGEKEVLKFTQKFNDASHVGCIKSLAVSPKGVLASGSTDEAIYLLNLERAVYVGSLVSHEGDITCLKYVGKDFLYSSSTDGTIRMWRTRIWELQRTFKGHKGAVLYFDVHPSKKLALSVGADKKLIAWDLVAGKYSFIRNMKKVCDAVVFNKTGSRYAIRSGSIVEIYDLTATDAIYTEDLKFHINDVAFLNDDIFVTASDNENLQVFDVMKKSLVMSFEAHEVRVRCVVPVRISSLTSFLLATCSTDGTMKAWSIHLPQNEAACLASIKTNCRITALTVHAPAGTANELLTSPDLSSGSVASLKKKKNSKSRKNSDPVESGKKQKTTKRNSGEVFVKKTKTKTNKKLA